MTDVRGLLYGVARDEDGNALSLAEIRLTEPGTTDLVPLYADRDSEIDNDILDQPVYTDRRGVYSYGVVPGVYDLRIIGRGDFDKTFPGTYVDQVDWSWDRGARIMLSTEGIGTVLATAIPSLIDVTDFVVDPIWNSENDDLVWIGETGNDLGKTLVTYVGATTKEFKVGLLANAWIGEAGSFDKVFTFWIYKNGSGAAANLINARTYTESDLGAVGEFPEVQFFEGLVELETDDTLEVFIGGPSGGGINIEIDVLKFWVTL
jgi:hypothetical protein